MKLLLITACPPLPSWGGAMTFYRHFCDRNDFEIYVITDNAQIQDYSVPYAYSIINRGNLWQRLANTRLSKVAHSWAHLWGNKISQTSKQQIIQQAKDFGADAIFTVAGSWSWMAKLAGDVAKQLNIPLVASFNDWWYYNLIRYRWLDCLIEREFRLFYQRCDLALCTSLGMQVALGSHANAVVLYPTGAAMAASTTVDHPSLNLQKPFTVAFGGSLGSWYGPMIELLITEAWQSNSHLQFRLFGSYPNWSDAFDHRVKAEGIFQGQVPFDQLRQEMENVDALLLLMGFDQRCAQIEKTSFKTKFLDYLVFQKPILLWGPAYCSAVQIAQEFDCAEICTSPQAGDYLKMIDNVQQNHPRQQQLIENSQRMYEERFHPDNIHQLLVSKITALIVQPTQ